MVTTGATRTLDGLAGERLQGLVTTEAGMDRLSQVLESVRRMDERAPNLLGLLHVLIGRRITTPGGEVVSAGLTWREAAALLKRVRWDKDAVRQLGLEPKLLPPRDRARFWYSAIARAQVDSAAARRAGNQLAKQLHQAGYQVSPDPPA
jgi:hypothetical protein